ncbi:serine hydrolase [Chitinophaga polysaccharea]|uniref:serine hydrolase n=1 Tax=Chitinophaga polysaccharea TaxID=1293035 RepID=UPI0014553C8A|nr:serine hydrolase [Chitinophaga polysaccharea]NLR60292.1 serine hydrolase [Chitinophaga polysaccharea]
MKVYEVLFLCLGIIVRPAWAQQLPHSISGKVIDAASSKPLPAANITVHKTGIGTVSNEAGEFRLQVPAAFQKDTLRISCLGYAVQYLPVAQMTSGAPIGLKPTGIQLKEVAVGIKDPLKLLQQAVKKIPGNYLTNPCLLKGFYRAVTQKDQEYLELSEAVFNIYSQGYGSAASNQLYLEGMRAVKDEAASHGVEWGLKPNNLFEFDVVNSMTGDGILGGAAWRKYVFALTGIVNYKGQPAYEITFDQREELKESLYKGRFYIDQASLAFLKVEYALSPKGLPYARYGDMVTRSLLKMLGMDIKRLKETTAVEYNKVGDRWVLSNAVNYSDINIHSKNHGYNFISHTKVDYIITNVDTTATGQGITGQKIKNDKLIEFHSLPPDTVFWRNNTIQLADFDAEAAFSTLRARNEAANLKKQWQTRTRKMKWMPMERIDSLLSFYHQHQQFNGTVLIRDNQGNSYVKHYGYADKEQQRLADSLTQYRIGSLSKSFTAIVILQLVEEGKLHLNDEVKKILPGYVHGEVTIEQLLTHQSGIPNYTNNSEYLSNILRQRFSLDELVTQFCSDSLDFTPGTRFQYSNSGYVVLARVIEVICHQPFPRVLKERIFMPAGMWHTYAGNTDTTAAGQLATGYLDNAPEPAYYTGNTLGAAGIVSTGTDLLRWNDALTTHTLLPQRRLEEMWQQHAVYSDWDAGYGYGWMIDFGQFDVSTESHRVIYHPGTDMGFYTMFARQAGKAGVVILLNNTGDFPRFDLTDMIFTALNEAR